MIHQIRQLQKTKRDFVEMTFQTLTCTLVNIRSLFSVAKPVGIAVDKDNNIWIASGKLGSLLVFNTKTLEFDKIIKIPNWPEQKRIIGFMIWEMKFDKNGNLWFTDELSNSIWKYFTKEGKFED